jgi:hypothetical protein
MNNQISWAVTYPEDLAYNTDIPKLSIKGIKDIETAVTKAMILTGEGYLPEEIHVVKHHGIKSTKQMSLQEMQYYDDDPYNTSLEDIFEDHYQTIQ